MPNQDLARETKNAYARADKLNRYTLAVPSLRVLAINDAPVLPLPSQNSATLTVRANKVEQAIRLAETLISQ